MKNFSRPAILLTLGTLLGAPLLASAATPGGIDISYLTPYSNGILDIVNGILVPLIIGISFITFLWGIYKYFILGATNELEQGDGRKFLMWGIIGFVVILSVWGIVNLVRSTFGLTTENAPPAPTFNTPTN